MPKLKKSTRTKNYIIEKSAPIFNRKGFYGTSMQDITEATGLTKGAIYGNFDNKDDIALAVFEHNSNQILQPLREIALSQNSAVEKLYAITRFYKTTLYDPVLQEGCPMLNTAVEADDTHPELRELVLKSVDFMKRSFTYIIEEGKKQGEFSQQSDSEYFAIVFVGLIEGGIMQTKIFNKSRFLIDCLSQMEQIIEQLRQ